MQTATDTNDVEQDTNNLDKDTLHELLSNSRRRAVLRILDSEGEVDKGDLSSLVAADEYGKDVDEVTSKERKRIHISLHQSHISPMEDAGVLKSNGCISKAENFDRVYNHIRYTDEMEFLARIPKPIVWAFEKCSEWYDKAF